MKKKTNCIVCGNETKWGGETCGRVCAGKIKKKRSRELRSCVFCNIEFETKKTSTTKLCSDECRKKWAQIPENKEKRIKKSQESIKANNGGKFFLQTDEFKEKSKKTKIDRYGDDNYVNNNKSKNTKKEKYGDENYNNMNKNKSTKKERYGDENYNNREKAANTMKELFGEIHAMKLEEYQKKAQDTNFKNTGFNFPLQNPKSQEEKIKTSIEKYGFEYASQSDEVKDKIREWYFDRFELTKIYKQLEISDIEILEEYKGLKKIEDDSTQYVVYNFRCNKCFNEFHGTFSNHRIPICRVCYPIYKNNVIHQEIYEFLKENKIEFEDNVRHIIKPYELDFYIEYKNMAIEFNGNYYHSEVAGGKDRNYHINKSKLCYNIGIKLIHIFEDEWLFKKDIVKSMLLNAFDKTENRVYARKCNIKEIDSDTGFNFLNNNHIQGAVNFNKAIGLYYNGKLESMMTFIKKKNDIWELNRFCSSQNTIVVGAFSKLFKYFLNNNDISLIKTFADCRWTGLGLEDNVYSKFGFEFIRKIKPRYFYFKKNDYLKRYHRFCFNKQKLIKLYPDKYKSWMSEWDLAQSVKMDRIWDCGKLSFKFSKAL